MDSLRSQLTYQPNELGFGTSGRRGKVVDLTQLEVYLNAQAELEYLQSLTPEEGGIIHGRLEDASVKIDRLRTRRGISVDPVGD